MIHKMLIPEGRTVAKTVFLSSLAGVCLSVAPAMAYESYHDPNQNDTGYCATCHSGFAGGRSDVLHSLHTGGTDPITSNCDLCHTGETRDNPLIMWSAGNNLGCMGCHGRDYGETIQANYRDFPIAGLHKNSGRGLRRHHANSGVTVCANCHQDAEPYPENVMNPGLGNTVHYYFRADVSLGGRPLDTCINEDSADPEFDNDTRGLDNDGDLLYDQNDPDCNPNPVLLTIDALTTGNLLISWPAPTPGFILQENAVLGTTDWVDKTAPTQRVMGSWRYPVSPAAPPRFYRLIKRP